MQVGIVCALVAEARTWPATAGRLCGIHDYRVKVAGPGQAAATAAATALHGAGCDALLCWGLAGGLDGALAPGDVLIADAVVDADGRRWPCTPDLVHHLERGLHGSGARTGTMLSATHALATTAAKHGAHARSGARVVEMEAAAVAGFAATHGCAFGAVRAVIDPADFDLPPAALLGLDAAGETRLLATLASLLRHPLQLPHLLQLGRWYRRALAHLASAATALAA